MALPQAWGGRFCLTKLVPAPGSMKTEIPKTTADTITTGPFGSTTGSAVPMATHTMIKAIGRPEAWRARTRRHTKGERQMQVPSTTHTEAMKTALARCSVIHADRKVR